MCRVPIIYCSVFSKIECWGFLHVMESKVTVLNFFLSQLEHLLQEFRSLQDTLAEVGNIKYSWHETLCMKFSYRKFYAKKCFLQLPTCIQHWQDSCIVLFASQINYLLNSLRIQSPLKITCDLLCRQKSVTNKDLVE